MARDDRMWGHDSYTYECWKNKTCLRPRYDIRDYQTIEEESSVKEDKKTNSRTTRNG